ncbi:MAG TPA: hypothetical protein VHX62_02375 [Solirubrobacteraceae bacterium]|nr:hypothetical protein [Solirubrobacteraceae bacterium]
MGSREEKHGMWHGLRPNALAGVAVLAAMAIAAPVAGASITPTLTLNQSAGTAAGSTANLGVDLKFAPTGTDSPDDMTLNLPPGLLANAAIDGGACLTTADLSDTACQVGTGTVTADAFGYIPITTPVTFDLVPPPAAGDLAGLAVNSSGTQIGSTADVKVRPSGDPDGVGITIDFVLPDSLYGTPISITEISSTFDGLRYPTTCPSTPQSFGVSVDSYSDPTVDTVTAPLTVTRCSSLTYAPAFTVTAARDSADKQVKLSTQIVQGADQAPSSSVSLSFPPAVLSPNLAAVEVLCKSLSAGNCTPVGSATATSPLYPRPLTGQAYFTGSTSGLSLTLVFPSPFPLTLTGAVTLATNTTTFSGLPDIPLTDLAVTLDSGAGGLYQTNCLKPSGTANAVLTDQNGDKTVTAPDAFTVAGCPGSGAGGGSGPAVTAPAVTGLSSGHPSLHFTLSAPRNAAKLRAFTIELPGGLSFVAHRSGRRATVRGVRLSGARIKSLALSHGHLVVTLRSAVSRLRVTVGSAALRESAALRARAKRIKSLRLTVLTTNAKGKRATIHVEIKHPGL